MSKKKIGIVISTKMEKTPVIQINTTYKHNKYSKVIRQSKKLFAHDFQERAQLGNLVEITQSKPISKLKCWVLNRILD